jgi:arylsulfatase A-like enzyme
MESFSPAMCRARFIRALIFASLLIYAGGMVSGATARVPNVLVVLVEGVGFSDWGCFGGEVSTPYLDWLSANGLRFSQAYRGITALETGESVLSGYFPGHFVSGRFPKGTGEFGASVEPKSLGGAGGTGRASGWRLLQGFRQAGYRIYRSGSRFGGGEPGEVAQEGGVKVVGVEDFLGVHSKEAGERPFLCVAGLSVRDWGVGMGSGGGPRVVEGGTEGGFAGLWKRRWERFQEQVGEGIGGGLPAGDGEVGWERVEREMELRWAWAERVDALVGGWLEGIKSLGALENTVVVVCGAGGDLGEGGTNGIGGCPLRWSRHGVHEASLCAPMIWSGPGLGKVGGQWRSQPVHVADLAPTLLRLAVGVTLKPGGAAMGPALDGVDLAPVLREGRPLVGRALWWQHGADRVFRLGDWKWISIQGQPAELYYLKADRSESVNLAEANFERISEMEVQWKRWRERFEREAGGASERPEPGLSPAAEAKR